MSFLKKITESGVSFADSRSEKRNVSLTNYISLAVASTPLLLIISLIFFGEFTFAMAGRLFASSLIFLSPLILNRLGFIVVSRVVLCWLPASIVFAVSIFDLQEGAPMSPTSFVGLRLFLITIGCFPFLVFNIKNTLPLAIGFMSPLLSILFFDRIFHFFGLGYLQSSLRDPLYEFNNVRALISLTVIGFSCYFLKRIIERGEQLNERLVIELAEKNKLTQQQAQDEVNQLNLQLQANLRELSEREFILQQSQRIAKVGSWEYKINSSFTFWSEEMFNIFGLDSGFDIKTRNLSRVIWGDESRILTTAAINLLRNGKPFDLTLRARTPLGYMKWVRVYAFPISQEGRIAGMRGICHDVTYYKEAEELLSVSENKYRTLFEQASDFIMVLDFKGNFIDVNASLRETFGYTKEELLGLKIESLIDPEQLKIEPIRYMELQRGDHVISHRRMMRKDRTIIDVEANVKKVQEDKMLVIARDVTKLREVQQQIELSEARFRGAFEYSAIGMALVSVDWKWLKVNQELCFILGYTEGELLSMTIQDVTYPEDFEQDREFIEQTMRGEIETYRRVKRYFHKNGALIWANVNVSLIRDNSDEPLYFVSHVEDITEEKKAEEKFMVSQANLNATINNTEVMIWSVDRNLRLLTFNREFFRYMQDRYGLELQPGILTRDSIGPELADWWEQKYYQALAGEKVTIEATRFGIDFQYSLSPIIEREQIIGVSVFADNVTERKNRDRELAEANKKIAELKLMALRSVMSPHFVFNVLNSIQFFIAKNDRLNAINYLSTFSKLIRSILTHSVTNKIRLDDEIEMLKNYVHLEMTRFENKFTFNLKIDPDVDVSAIEIPSLLIQPYVENAILHGLYNKSDQGTLEISIYENDDAVIFEIQDDGIGREEAMKLRQRNFPVHKSMGIKLTEERLKLINQHHHAAFEIEDLVNEKGPCGTRVRIRVTI